MTTRVGSVTRARAAMAVIVVLFSLAVTGCFNPFQPRITSDRGISEPPPVPDTPRGLMLLFVWCWENRAIAEYRELFTEDYRFAFAAADSAGNAFQDRALTRDEELESAANLFVGGSATEPPANRIVLDLDPNIIALPDSRPGKIDPWHKEISTEVNLTISTNTAEFRVTGRARFFVVSGDSALIPPELSERGPPFDRNPNRWYIERWEDETAGQALTGAIVEALSSTPGRPPSDAGDGTLAAKRASASAAAGGESAPPTLSSTWGTVKALYYRGFGARAGPPER